MEILYAYSASYDSDGHHGAVFVTHRFTPGTEVGQIEKTLVEKARNRVQKNWNHCPHFHNIDVFEMHDRNTVKQLCLHREQEDCNAM